MWQSAAGVGQTALGTHAASAAGAFFHTGFPQFVGLPQQREKKLKKQACELPVDNIPAASFVIPPLPPHSRPLEEKEEKA